MIDRVLMIRLLSNRYTIVDKFKLVYNYILTKLLYPGQRIVRQPFVLRGGGNGQMGYWTYYRSRV